MRTVVTCLMVAAVFLLTAGRCQAADQEALRAVLDTHPARAAATWQNLAGKPIRERILPAPAVLIDYLIADNQYQGYTDRPRPAVIDPVFLEDIAGAVEGIAPAARRHIRDHVVAIFLARDLGSTAYGELLRDFGANKMGFIVLDVDALNRRANDWITWRERSPFAGSGPTQLIAGIAGPAGDTRAAAIRYILLHEIGHIVGVAKKAHSSWFDGGDPKDFGFSAISWVAAADGKGKDSRFDAAFTQRRRITYYRFEDALLNAAQMVEIYKQLTVTDFVSLYAATNMYEDFAETYAMYVHVVLQGQSWTVDVQDQNGARVLQLVNPILETRCRAKKQYLDQWFR